MKTEADTCRTYIVPNLHTAGWDDEHITEQMVLTRGRIVPIGDRHTRKEGLRPDYTLFIRQNIPLRLMEAKAEYTHPAKGLQQAMQYAEMLDVKFAYSSNGKGIVEHDFITGMERDLMRFQRLMNYGDDSKARSSLKIKKTRLIRCLHIGRKWVENNLVIISRWQSTKR